MNLRCHVYLNANNDLALMLELERWNHGRRSGRLRELARLGAEAEGLESKFDSTILYRSVQSTRTPQRSLWELTLRVSGRDLPLFARLEEATNRSDRIRILATKGLEREAALRTPQAHQLATPAPTSRVNDQASAALRQMMGALAKGS